MKSAPAKRRRGDRAKVRPAVAAVMNPVELSDFLPFLILRTASRITTYFNRATAWTDLTIADARTLGAVWFKSGIRLAELAQVTDIDLSTLSRLVRRLERRNLLLIEKRNSDARSGALKLSAKGLTAINRVGLVGLRIEAALEADLSHEDALRLKALLRRVTVPTLEG
jgi:DNA-binding MarR family transcriptional regulator